MTLTSPTLEVTSDPLELVRLGIDAGWGDGLPVVPPTADLVTAYVDASGLDGGHSLGALPPLRGECTIEKVAINTVLAGAPREAMPLVLASLRAMIDPAFDLGGVNATTNSAIPAVVVNGPIRDRLDIPYRYAAFGGVASPAPAIGRAIRLVMRNVAGQVAGQTSEGVFGQPSRTTGIVVGEWEERSPWAPLAERRGVSGDAVTAFPAIGNVNVLDSVAETGREVLEVIGKSLAYMGNNNFSAASTYADQMVAINPIWANERIARDIPSHDDAREIVWQAARLPLAWFPETLRPFIEQRGRIDADGMVYLMESPEEVHLFVCGGLGSNHAMMLPGFSHCIAVTEAVT